MKKNMIGIIVVAIVFAIFVKVFAEPIVPVTHVNKINKELFQAAEKAYKVGDYKKAFTLYEKDCLNGSAISCNYAGNVITEVPEFMTENYLLKARAYFQSACNAGILFGCKKYRILVQKGY